MFQPLGGVFSRRASVCCIPRSVQYGILRFADIAGLRGGIAWGVVGRLGPGTSRPAVQSESWNLSHDACVAACAAGALADAATPMAASSANDRCGELRRLHSGNGQMVVLARRGVLRVPHARRYRAVPHALRGDFRLQGPEMAKSRPAAGPADRSLRCYSGRRGIVV